MEEWERYVTEALAVQPQECHALILDPLAGSESIVQVTDWLAGQSRETVLLRPGRVVPYNDLPSEPGMAALMSRTPAHRMSKGSDRSHTRGGPMPV